MAHLLPDTSTSNFNSYVVAKIKGALWKAVIREEGESRGFGAELVACTCNEDLWGPRDYGAALNAGGSYYQDELLRGLVMALLCERTL